MVIIKNIVRIGFNRAPIVSVFYASFQHFTVRQGVFKVMHCYAEFIDCYPQKSNVSSTIGSFLFPAESELQGGHETDGN